MAHSTPISTLSFPSYLYNRIRLTRVISEGSLLIGGNEGYNDMHPRHSFLHRRLMYIKFHDLVSLFGGFNDHFRLRIEGRCCDSWRIVDSLVQHWFYDRGAGLGYYPSEHYPFEPLEVDMIMFENDVKFSLSFISNAQDLEAWAQGWVTVLRKNLEDCIIPCMVNGSRLLRQPWSPQNLPLWPLSARRRARAFMLMLGRGQKLRSCSDDDPLGAWYAHALPTEVLWNVLGSVDASWMLLPARDAPPSYLRLICPIVGLGDNRRPPCKDGFPSKKRKK